MVTLEVTEEEAGERLDIVAVRHIEVSRAFIKKLSDDEKITVNGAIEKAGHKLKSGDSIEIDYDPSELDKLPAIDLPILYEDDNCLVLNKPAGMLTHSKGAFNPEATVATFLRSKINGLTGDRAGIVHRLDRATSGVIICAKNPTAMSWLQKQFSTRKVTKTYIAIVQGAPKPGHAVIDMPIERNPKVPSTFRVGTNGKEAVTEYLVESAGPKYSSVKLVPKTGRTHQLRVHMKQLGHPIVGDLLYGGEPADRMYLHAESLEITLPNHRRKTFTAHTPKEFATKMGQQQ